MVIHKLEQLIGFHIQASDGEIGKIKDVYFDDHSWAVRYLVVEASARFIGRKVLISPISVAGIDWDDSVVRVSLTQQQVRTSPPIDTDKPVSRQHEVDFFEYYGYSYYWSGPSLWGGSPNPVSPAGPIPPMKNAANVHADSPADPRLRSAREVIGYRLETTTESMGYVEDFLVDPESWAIRYLVVDTRSRPSPKHVVIPPQWIRDVDWSQRVVSVDVSAGAVKASPEFDSSVEFSRAHETNLYQHYQRHEVPMSALPKSAMPHCAPIDPARREDMIRECVYFRSQLRGPPLAHESEDWLAAEQQIDRMLTGHARDC